MGKLSGASNNETQESRGAAYVILAAGIGSRIAGSVNGAPKWLVAIGDRLIADTQLDALTRVTPAVDDVLVVAGYEAARVRAFVDSRPSDAIPLRVVENERFAERNNWYTLLLALEEFDRS